jgi:methyl-accepting chemotaxis protein
MVESAKISYLKKVFFASHLTGLVAGGLFPLIVSPLIGPAALSWPFILSCLVMGIGVGAILFFFVRVTLKSQLRQHLELLRPLAGEIAQSGDTVEALHAALETSVGQVETMIGKLLTTVETFVPHYRSLAESSRYLSERAHDGLAAARSSRTDVESMDQKQQQVMAQVQTLANRAQDEAAISRELYAP